MSKTYCPHNVSAGYVCLNCPSGWATPSKRTVQGPSDATDCSASLKWKQSGPEWQAQVHPEFQYVAMEIEGAWHAFLFLGSKYKRGHTIAIDFETANDAKQKCQDHYESLLPQNAIAMASADTQTSKQNGQS